MAADAAPGSTQCRGSGVVNEHSIILDSRPRFSNAVRERCTALGRTRCGESGVVDERRFVFRSRFSAAVKLRTGEPGVVEAGCLTELVGLVPAASCTLPLCFRDAGLFSHKWFFPASVKDSPPDLFIVSFSWWHLITGRTRYTRSGYYELPPNTFADSSCDLRMQGLCSVDSQGTSVKQMLGSDKDRNAGHPDVKALKKVWLC